jgi:radical SAM superfamily enzyme YgiQ (UPF0313 family)
VKITLVQPRAVASKGIAAEEHWQLTRPFSLIYLAQSLKEKTPYEVEIVDLEQKKFNDQSLEKVFANNGSDIFGITAATYTRFEAVAVVKVIKKLYPDATIVAGGVHFMYCPEETLQDIREIDIVVRGEGEITIVKVANAIHTNSSLEDIKGITCRHDGKILTNADQKIFEDLDHLPTYTRFSWDEYPEYLFSYPEPLKAVSIMSSRGCPFGCIFCAKAGMKYRLRDATNVVDEIELFKTKFDVDGINFLDLTFTANPNHVKSICQKIIDRNIDVKWWCESRANIPLESIDLMKKAGCVSLAVGVESGSPSTLSRISKGISLDQVVRFCEKCNNLGIYVTAYFMFSFPDETEQAAQETLKLIEKLEHIGAYINCELQPAMIFPGTKLEKIARERHILSSAFSWYKDYESELNLELGQLSNIPLFTDCLSQNQLLQIMKQRTVHRKASVAAKMNLLDLVVKAFQTIRKNRNWLAVVSPKFYYEFFRIKLGK